jgi:hypothetical protein
MLEDAVQGCIAQPAADASKAATKLPLWPTPLRSAKSFELSGLEQNYFVMRVPAAEIVDLWRQRVRVRGCHPSDSVTSVPTR